MIKIEHPELVDIVADFSTAVEKKFIRNANIALYVIDLLQEKNEIALQDITGKGVKLHISALKLICSIDKLLDSKKTANKETNDLVYTLNKLKIKGDKRSKCRKTKRINELKNRIKYLIQFIQSNDLFNAKPKDLLILNATLNKKMQASSKRLYDYFFDYQKYYDELNNGIGKRLDLKCCPYCNRNYITYIPDVNKRIIGPSYDHFFSKTDYKYLTLSFYNLIPSCNICNSNLKGKIDFKLEFYMHPYLNGFDEDVNFDFDLDSKKFDDKKVISFKPTINISKDISQTKEKQIIGSDPNNKKNKEGNLNVFKLREVYESHSDTVQEIYVRLDKNSIHYVGSINKIIEKLGTSESEFYRYHFRNYFDTKDFNKRPLSKLNKDIYLKMKEISELTLE